MSYIVALLLAICLAGCSGTRSAAPVAPLTLEVPTAETIEAPSEVNIVAALEQNLRDGKDERAVILSRDEQHYIQVWGSVETRMLLEFRDGGSERHFRAIDEKMELNVIKQAFLDYYASNPQWNLGIEFEKKPRAIERESNWPDNKDGDRKLVP